MEYYFDTDDKLERKKYAEFLKSMLENCDKYRREDSDGAYVIAIDSPWGTGKTRFVKMLRNFLENRKSDTPTESPIDPSNGFLTVYYNAWDTDFSTDALEPLVYSLINSREFESDLFEQQADEEIKEFIGTAKKVLKVIGLSASHHFLGETVTKVIETCIENEDKSNHDDWGFEKKRQAIQSFRDTLSRVIAKTKNEKLVIIIDELDRCRPTFAIQTLELAKHLFSVDGLIFIFALDIKQLSCSIKTVYGQEMDASGYLCRFFDYIGKMPTTDERDFIKLCLEQHRAFTATPEPWTFKIPDYIGALATSFSLSLRDLTTITKTYQLMLDSYLTNYKFPQFHLLYLFLLTLKYKNGSLYSEFLIQIKNDDVSKSKDSSLTRVKNYLPEIVTLDRNILANQLQRLSVRTELSKHVFGIYSNFIERAEREQFALNCIIETTKMESDKNGNLKLVIYPRFRNDANGGTHPGNPEFFDYSNVLSDVLEINDLYKWDSIKYFSLGQYFYQQLEMFNFALPADEPTTQS